MRAVEKSRLLILHKQSDSLIPDHGTSRLRQLSSVAASASFGPPSLQPKLSRECAILDIIHRASQEKAPVDPASMSPDSGMKFRKSLTCASDRSKEGLSHNGARFGLLIMTAGIHSLLTPAIETGAKLQR